MNRRAPMAAGLLVSVVASTAHADLTVYFATDGPTGPMLASAGGRAPEDATPSPVTPAAHITERPAPREVLFVRVGDDSFEEERLTLLDAHGAPDSHALERLSILARPRGTHAPERTLDDPELVAPGIRRLHPALLSRVALIAERFPSRGIEIVSGYRPDAREGSRHRHARALDLRVRGERIEAVRDLLEALPETGVGFYPTSGFVHVDIRERSVHWTDRSGPGEPPAVILEGEPDPSAVDEARRAIDALQIDLGLTTE